MEKYDTPVKDVLNIPGINTLTEDEKALIENNSNIVNYNTRDVIIKQNTRTSHVMFIKSGLVKVYKEGRNEKVIILQIARPGDFIGLLSLLGDKIYHYSASSLSKSQVIFIDVGVFNEIVSNNGFFAAQLMKQISKEGLHMLDKLMNNAHKQLPGRIADVLLFFSKNIYNSNVFELPMTRRELAEFACTTKESFIRTLAEFQHDRIINLNKRRVDIISMDILQTLSRLG